jgi:phosphoglycolate phosphatase
MAFEEHARFNPRRRRAFTQSHSRVRLPFTSQRQAPAPTAAAGAGNIRCNICGCQRFAPDKRGWPICEQCRSKPRHRAMMLAIDTVVRLAPGQRVLHLAPEIGIARRIEAIVGDGYDPRDFDAERAAAQIGRHVGRLDLCTEAASLEADSYDLILHNHVIEHIPCNYTMALLRLQAALKPGGFHLFTAPMTGGYFREDNDPRLTPEERAERFLQGDHMRRFGTRDFAQSLGAVFGISNDYAMLDVMSEADMARANIPARFHRGVSGATVFIVRKER